MRLFAITILGIALVMGFFLVPSRAGSPRPQDKKSSFDNIKVMNDMSDSEVMTAMRQWQDELGTNCSFCHAGADFASEENPKKQTARVMYKMLKQINKDFLNGKGSCATCHNGNPKPAAEQ